MNPDDSRHGGEVASALATRAEEPRREPCAGALAASAYPLTRAAVVKPAEPFAPEATPHDRTDASSARVPRSGGSGGFPHSLGTGGGVTNGGAGVGRGASPGRPARIARRPRTYR